MGQRRKVVLVTSGTLGDVLPFIALARALANKGFEPVVAIYPCHAGHVAKAGVATFELLPDLTDILRDTGVDPRRFVERMAVDPAFFPKSIVLPNLRRHVDALETVIQGACAVVAHVASPAASVAADRARVPCITVLLSPFLAPSAYDPPIIPPLPFVPAPASDLAVAWNRMVIAAFRLALGHLSRPVSALRRELGLAPSGPSFSAFRSTQQQTHVLGLYSPLLGRPQADHPTGLEVVGSAFQPEITAALAPEVAAFLDAGEPPIVVTMGSQAAARDGFYDVCVEAARRTQRRLLLLVPDAEFAGLEYLSSPDVHIAGFVPHGAVLPRACLVIHHGGMGTATEVLKAGVPQIVVPICNDQFDNAARLARLGVSRALHRTQVEPAALADAIQRSLAAQTAEYAAAIAETIRTEDGAARAADRIAQLV